MPVQCANACGNRGTRPHFETPLDNRNPLLHNSGHNSHHSLLIWAFWASAQFAQLLLLKCIRVGFTLTHTKAFLERLQSSKLATRQAPTCLNVSHSSANFFSWRATAYQTIHEPMRTSKPLAPRQLLHGGPNSTRGSSSSLSLFRLRPSSQIRLSCVNAGTHIHRQKNQLPRSRPKQQVSIQRVRSHLANLLHGLQQMFFAGSCSCLS